MKRLGLFLSLLFSLACGDDDGSTNTDVGPVDGGGDAPSAADATPDVAEDTAATGDSGADASAPACVTDPDDVYATAPVPGARGGTVLSCAFKEEAAVAGVEARIALTGVTATSGYRASFVAYQTLRDDEREGVGSAIIFVPDTPRENTPIVAVAHGTVGHADTCAPSLRPADVNLALPWVGLGYTTIAVDYAGLGTDGIQGYGDAYDTAQSLLDGARAALEFVGETRPIILVGHSQGGRAVHMAQGLAPTYAPELDITHAIAFAGSPTAPNTLTPASARLVGRVPLSATGRAFFAMSVYADFANAFGEERALEPFMPDLREVIGETMENDCIIDMITAMDETTGTYVPPNNVGELLSEELLNGLPLCVADDPGCTDEARVLLRQRFDRSYIAPASDGAPILMIAGATDAIHTPNAHVCAYDEQVASGAMVSRCFVDGENHFTIVSAGIASAIAWASGEGLACPAEASPPACR